MPNTGGGGTGTSPNYASRVVHGTRRRTFLREEDEVVIDRSAFKAIETTIRDRQAFLTIAVGCFGFSTSLMLEKGIDYIVDKDTTSGMVFAIAVPFFIFGCVFAGLYLKKRGEYKTAADALFKKDRLISDITTIITEDGTKVDINNLTQA